MNFTREPIIETIITPKDGYNLVVRNSKGGSQEEYHVDSVEVVSFGHSFFFRSLERPKSFLVPAGDYEIVELKETRVVLKNVNIERSIKIGGGRQASTPVAKEVSESVNISEEETVAESSAEASTAQPLKSDRKRDRRRNRRGRRSSQEERPMHETTSKEVQHVAAESAVQGGGGSDETQVSSSMFSSLFPPPPTLISETIARYKEKNPEYAEGNFLSKPVEEKEHKKKKEVEDEGPNGEEEASSETESHLHRVSEDDNDYFLI
ncbi:MAG: hypothetical protein V4494_00435 [Chlamydiota bacterium]